MKTGFWVEAWREALRVAGRAPGIRNGCPLRSNPWGQLACAPFFVAPLHSDQGNQFTSDEWIEAVEPSGARVSMDEKGGILTQQRFRAQGTETRAA